MCASEPSCPSKLFVGKLGPNLDNIAGRIRRGPRILLALCASACGSNALQLAKAVQHGLQRGAQGRSQPQVLDDKERKKWSRRGDGVPTKRQLPAEAPRPQTCTPAGQQTECTGVRDTLAVSRTCIRAGCMA